MAEAAQDVKPHQFSTSPEELNKLLKKYGQKYYAQEKKGNELFTSIQNQPNQFPDFSIRDGLVMRHVLAINDQPVLEPEDVLKTRKVQHQGQYFTQLLIKWKQLPTAEATWEWMEDIQTNYPAFNLEGKVESDGEGTVTIQGPGPGEPNPMPSPADASAKNKRTRNSPPWHKDFVMRKSAK
ncbi:hypothetical protein COLO4_10142 [Corchorus olitorius]|uniref:Chromo domain-containing protein n=1 Tax=Corchorus olitorius TaxID=93759 RepID=A0A1R3K9U0_9ROSI|nr:hypothetical protein COLO4_10142 [Corchorus olitorius]